MADGMNRVTLFGALGADPELRMTGGGQAVLKLRMATSESYLDKNRVRQERTEWHGVVVWGKRAEALSKLLSKGSKLLVEGSLRTSSYEVEGQKRYRTEIVAKEIFLAGAKSGGGSDAGSYGGGSYGGGTEAPSRTGSAGGTGYDDTDYGSGDDDIPF